MNPTSVLQLLQGPFNFLRQEPEEILRLMPDLQKALPTPRPIFLEDESAKPLLGFPVLLSEGMEALRQALRQYIAAEEGVQVAMVRRDTAYDRKSYNACWERYRSLLSRAVENATTSSYGRQYPAIFWLHHSLEVARTLKDTPKRIARLDTEIGRRQGDAIKYRVYDRFLDRVLATTYEMVQKVAGATEEIEEELFPRLLTRMRDNVLIFTEDYIGRDLAELGSYFAGSLRIDGRDFRQRLEELVRWHAEQLAGDKELRSLAVHVAGMDPAKEARDLLNRPGWLTFLAGRKGYNAAKLLPPPLVQVWESLLIKLKEFELMHGLRRALVTVELRSGAVDLDSTLGVDRWAGTMIARDIRSTAGGETRLSSATRPLDFMEAWVVDPRVERFGMIYDISDFSQTLSVLHRGGNESQDEAFRRMFRFQRRINRLAHAHRAKLEKYLGDGAFYSSREATNLLVCSVHLQRYYEQAVREGLPFDRGMRIALNYGSYRMIPMGARPEEGERYEFFGPGLVELSRLTTGKATQEIDEVKTMLMSQGYPEATVHRFFAPLAARNVDVVDKREEARRFYCYINRNGTLHNNGMVGTGPFVAELEKELKHPRLRRGTDGQRIYVLLEVEHAGDRMTVGFRKLGFAHLKGLEKLAVYEIVDGATLDPASYADLPGLGLSAAIEREFSTTPRTPGSAQDSGASPGLAY